MKELDALLNEKLGVLIEGDFSVEVKPAEKPKTPEPLPSATILVQEKIKTDVAPLPPLPKINIGDLMNGDI